MSENSATECKPVKIGLLGASFDTGNLGVSALAESSIKVILNRWPDAEVILIGSGQEPGEHRLKINSRELCIKTVPIRFCKNVFLGNHFLILFGYALVFKVFRWKWFKQIYSLRNCYLKEIIETDIVADITGGDSFSDIYGMHRFTLGFLCKWLVLLYGKPLIMLPQTYGPFKRRLTKVMARFILKRSGKIYSRDQRGVDYVQDLLKNHDADTKARFCPDVAFVLDSHKPKNIDVGLLEKVRTKDTFVVGLNISGLLFNGGYTRDNMFGLKVDYPDLIYSVIDLLMRDRKSVVLLIPHVFAPIGDVESDTDACLQVYNTLHKKFKDKLFHTQRQYDQNESKYIIGMCNFFIGSRMHSCIAALSQCIPAIGIAYSKKFEGIFEGIGLAECVVDMRNLDERESLKKLESLFECKDQIREHLMDVMPEIKNSIYSIFGKSQLTRVGVEH